MHGLKYPVPILLLLLLGAGLAQGDPDFRGWSLEQAAAILNGSPWVRQETYTRIIGGIGSGIQGEKEIYSTYFVRLLSAAPIRRAYARIRQIQLGYDRLDAAARARIDSELQPVLDLDVRDWIVVAVTFRCNEPREEARIERFFANESTETARNRAYLSTTTRARVLVEAYFPPREPLVGARFVFPRHPDGSPLVSESDRELIFELDTPSSATDLRAVFRVAELEWEGRPEL
ncbi:MAG: hypothetical protein Kow001_10560 [Acidobacteriota bacterium]